NLVEHLRELQRLDRGGGPGDVAKIVVDGGIVHGGTRRAGLDGHASDGFAAASRAVEGFLGRFGQRIRARTQIASIGPSACGRAASKSFVRADSGAESNS